MSKQGEGIRIADWSLSDLELIPSKDPPSTAPVIQQNNVVYDQNGVTAYFNSLGQSVDKAHATWAKVWTPDGQMSIVQLTNENQP